MNLFLRTSKLFSSIILIVCFSFTPKISFAQKATVTGKFIDAKTKAPLQSVGLMLKNQVDSTKFYDAITDASGKFELKNIPFGKYKLKTFSVGYKKIDKEVIVDQAEVKIGIIRFEQSVNKLSAVTIEEQAVRTVQKNDTTEYNANAYKVNKDATTGDLVTKMPGVTTDGGVVKAQGETVQKVLIDGKEYFGDDANIALKNIPAEVVDKIQVFDRMSDQSFFTGFDDGNTTKTMNILTRNGKSNGIFGKVYGGYGTDNTYNGGGNLNFFQGARRISIIGLTNNINQQNFSTQDLLGVTGGGGGGGRGGPGGFGMGNYGGGGGGSGLNNFIVGNQNGINKTNSVGLNYIDTWGKKVNVQASYFFNDVSNTTENSLNRTYFRGDSTTQRYAQNSITNSDNQNHRFSLRLEYNIDTMNSIIFTPRLSFQNYSSNYTLYGANILPNGKMLNQTSDVSNSNNSGYSFSNNLLLRHKFKKAGRTISLNIGTDYNSKNTQTDLSVKNDFYKNDTLNSDSAVSSAQRAKVSSLGYNVSPSLNYTEPLGKMAQIMVNYTPSYAVNNYDKEMNLKDTSSGEFSKFNNSLSNKYSSTTAAQRGGLSLRMRTEKAIMMLGLNYQVVDLSGNVSYPVDTTTTRTFSNLLPGGMFMYKFSKNIMLRMFYRTSINTPSISQLQTVTDNSNPLLLSTGNPNLVQAYTNMFVTRFSLSTPDKGRTFFIFLNGNYTSNYIGNQTLFLNDGVQLSRPVNLDGYYNLNSYVTYGFAIKKLKSNLNLNAGVSYNRTPGMINDKTNFANTTGLNSGFVLGSNISELVDFTISYSGNYYVVDNTLQSQTNNNYFYHTAMAKVNLLPFKKTFMKNVVFTTDFTQNYYTGLGNSYNLNYYLWNGGVGYKFLKNQAAEFRLVAFDILNQNSNISRTVAVNY
ncbi:MAG: TonB-dependent receptor domain-containing protein, partial [Bacteroidia bacterium]